MDINEYRILHSKIIEQYQFIEFHLEGLFALIQNNGDDFEELAKRVENDAMGELIRKVRFLVKEKSLSNVITKNDFYNLEKIRDDRNYYCHENFLNNITDNYQTKRTTTINQDLEFVTNMNSKLKEIFKNIKNSK